jgi:hypothetical protein
MALDFKVHLVNLVAFPGKFEQNRGSRWRFGIEIPGMTFIGRPAKRPGDFRSVRLLATGQVPTGEQGAQQEANRTKQDW